MSGDTPITIVGNLVADPEIRFTPSGAAVCNGRVASTPRTFNKQTNEWEDGEGLFLTFTIWRQAAENVANSLRKGDRVVVVGVLRQRSYETREGEQRTVYEINADEVAASTKYATIHAERNPRGSGGSQGGRNNAQGRGSGTNYGGGYSGEGNGFPPADDDPWATGGQQGGAWS